MSFSLVTLFSTISSWKSCSFFWANSSCVLRSSASWAASIACVWCTNNATLSPLTSSKAKCYPTFKEWVSWKCHLCYIYLPLKTARHFSSHSGRHTLRLFISKAWVLRPSSFSPVPMLLCNRCSFSSSFLTTCNWASTFGRDSQTLTQTQIKLNWLFSDNPYPHKIQYVTNFKLITEFYWRTL